MHPKFLPFILLLTTIGCSLPQPNPIVAEQIHEKHIATKPHLPKIGKWMIGPDGTSAHWLGASYHGKKLREPINIIIEDRHAKSPEEAKNHLIEACTRSGYPPRAGHSSGYSGFIGDQLYPQLPNQRDHAFSNGPFEFNNNHGRIFGPRYENGKYYFIGALSRERIALLQKVKHAYASFNEARDDFAASLDQKTDYKISKFLPLDNALTSDQEWSTGDHDGVAVVLTAEP